MRLLLLPLTLLFTAASAVGCGSDDPAEAPTPATGAAATTVGDEERAPTAADVEAARRDASWRGFTEGEAAAPAVPSATPVRADTAAYARALRLPLSGDAEGDAVLYLQVLLDRARFSPGQIDGRWGQNTEKALYWLQRREGLDATGTLDRATLPRLLALAEAPERPAGLLVEHQLTAADVEGPFRELPEDVYERAELDRLRYESLGEQLGERFHVAPALLEEWHGGPLGDLAAGDVLRVPSLRPSGGAGGGGASGAVARLVVSDGGRYLHALGADGRILRHFPSTLGSSYDPSPTDTLEIVAVAPDPTWHYQPDLLADVPDSRDDAVLPPGPNNAVGVVWLELSKEHYGIHGTAYPATIGHTTSAGCVRLTNWDARTLAGLVGPGTPVAFRDADGRGA